MEDKKKDILDDKDIENEESSDINTIEKESVTREINLDELYDGAINNTVVIDPITKDEVLLETKKSNGKILGIIFAILVLLLLYFVNNKMNINNDEPNVAPVSTTTTTIKEEYKTGSLDCTYSSSSSSETQNATFTALYENDKILSSEFNFNVVLLTDTASENVLELKGEYENFFINNSSVSGGNVSFEKDDKGFNFKFKIDYDKFSFEKISYEDGKTKLYALPSSNDTLESVKLVYTNKGYECSIISDSNK